MYRKSKIILKGAFYLCEQGDNVFVFNNTWDLTKV